MESVKEAQPNKTWAVALFSSRETPEVLSRSFDAAVNAFASRTGAIDVVVNGNADLAQSVAKRISLSALPEGLRARVWFIAMGDKAHAWNQYQAQIWPGAEITFFVDGYAEVNGNAFCEIEHAFAAKPKAWAASGVPTFGRSANALRLKMLASGGIHGNLYALSGRAMSGIRALQFRLPLGIYRTDPTLAAALCFSLDPRRFDWDQGRIAVCDAASWVAPELSSWRFSDLRTHWRRRLRQAQGRLETAAVQYYFQKRKASPSDLPDTVHELLRSWAADNPDQLRRLLVRDPLCIAAWRSLQKERSWPQVKAPPVLVFDTAPSSEQSKQDS